MSLAQRVHWLGANTAAEGRYSLVARARAIHKRQNNAAASGRRFLVVGAADAFQAELIVDLQNAGLQVQTVTPNALDAASDADYTAILCSALSNASQLSIASAIQSNPHLAHCRFEYVSGLDPAQRLFAQHDEYANTFFVSPVLRGRPSPYVIYEESLKLFEQKCGLRDYLDLYQSLHDIERRGIAGDIAEFGSYRGHSGWLIARTLQALGSSKTLWMFDMFESFPDEQLGIDQFWSKTHHVDFAEVQRKLSSFPNVCLVKGDFTKTLPEAGLPRLALAYLDCDSYRGTRYLLESLAHERLSVGGLLICEDYGHPALLGNRLAVHDVMDGHRHFAQLYSQFSGLYSFIKLAAHAASDSQEQS